VSTNPITVKNELSHSWLNQAEQAKQERNRISSQYHPHDWHEADGRLKIYSEAARILASSDGIDHVKEGLRERMAAAKDSSSIRVWASLITELETAAA
jgi:hypothetical protein